jgi:hypothetical protein
MSKHVVAKAVAVAAAFGVTGGVIALGTSAHSANVGTELNLTFEGASLRHNAGGADLTVRIATHNGGKITGVGGPSGGTAARLPSFDAGVAPQAVITVTDENGVDDLSPGNASFRFGAKFKLDNRSTGTPSDNGDNLIQRGLIDAPVQYKLQIDAGHPSCRIKGSAGEVVVRSDRVVPAGEWHRATCSRRSGEVVLSVVRLSDSRTWTYRAPGRVGTVTAAAGSPLSVGGKVNTRGEILTDDSDQFNGSIDNAFLNVF